jgi:hypothetical protein
MRSIRSAVIGLSLFFAAISAHAVESLVRKSSAQSVDALWQKIGDFCGISAWEPAIAKCELSTDKKRRTLTLKDGATVIEELKRWNDASHSYTYRVVASPLPVANYESTIQVTSNKAGTGSVITWRGRYVAKGANDVDAKKIIDGIYESGLATLAGD